MKTKITILALSLAITNLSLAIENKTNENLEQTVKMVGKLTNTKYIYSLELKGDNSLSKDYIFNAKNGDFCLSHLLHLNGYSRIDAGPRVKKIISAKEVMNSDVKTYETSKKDVPKIPLLSDYFIMKYRFQNEVSTNNIITSFRGSLSPFGRIISKPKTREIWVKETGSKLGQIHKILSSFDVDTSSSLIKRKKINLPNLTKCKRNEEL